MEHDQQTLHDYFRVLRERWWVVLAALVACIAIGLLYSLAQTPLYRSDARVLVAQGGASEVFDPVSGTNTAWRAILNEVEGAESDQVEERANERLAELLTVAPGGTIGDSYGIAVAGDTDRDVLRFTGTATEASEAAIVAQVYAEAYIDVRLSERVDDYLDTADRIEERADELRTALASEAISDNEERRLEAQLENLSNTLDDLTLTATLAQDSSARVITAARVPSRPFVPTTNRNVVLGAMVGLMAGVGLALLFDALDRSIASPEELESVTGGKPNLAIVPTVKEWRRKDETHIVSRDNPKGITAEAYRTLRAAIEFAAVDREVKVLQLTSANPGEGKTTTSVNLAVVMAQAGKRVVLVDADLRKPRVHVFWALNQEPGLTSAIIGQAEMEDALQLVADEIGLLAVMPSGPLPPGPSELLGSDRAEALFAALRRVADIVIIDSPPVLPVSDSLVLSRLADATLIVANGARTDAAAVGAAYEQLAQVEANVIGSVLNEVRRGRGGYGYGYGYTQNVPKEPRLSLRRKRSGVPAMEMKDPFAEVASSDSKARRSSRPDPRSADNVKSNGNGQKPDSSGWDDDQIAIEASPADVPKRVR